MSCIRNAVAAAFILASASVVLAHNWPGDQRREHVPKLYDANGKLVGDVVDGPKGGDSDGGVLMDVNGAPVFVGFALAKAADGSKSASKLIWSGVEPAYSEKGCTGTSYIPYALGSLRPAAIERKGSKATLLVAKDESSRIIVVRSRSYSGSCSDYYGDAGLAQWAVGDSINLTDSYPEPLRIGN
ncbi:hypothetical protein [Caballeronia grimmiae]|uniref:hypothetical protein n=1 Tax=Caballeronia grimmiae TaxID=1071679 RepID=UPI0038BA791F